MPIFRVDRSNVKSESKQAILAPFFNMNTSCKLAVKANAMIITWNLADFKRASSFGVTVMTPRNFLNELENPK